jgi:hypothetical protein
LPLSLYLCILYGGLLCYSIKWIGLSEADLYLQTENADDGNGSIILFTVRVKIYTQRMAKWSFIARPRAKVAVMKSILNIDYNRLPARLHPL